MHRHLGLVVGLLVALTGTALSAQQSTCTLLTTDDIATITGAEPGEPRASDMAVPSGPSKGKTVHTCSWGVAGNGMVNLSMVEVTEGSREAGLVMLEQAYAMLRAQNWTEERKDFSGGTCSIMTPPPSQKDLPISSGCFTEAKGMGMAVGVMSRTQKLPMEKTWALLEKAVSRMP
jgi:hypothetical protein